MFIASKYEEIYPPEAKDFIYISDNTYTKQEMFAMEIDILDILDYTITVPSPFRFLERYARISNLNDVEMMLAQYLLELSLVDYNML